MRIGETQNQKRDTDRRTKETVLLSAAVLAANRSTAAKNERKQDGRGFRKLYQAEVCPVNPQATQEAKSAKGHRLNAPILPEEDDAPPAAQAVSRAYFDVQSSVKRAAFKP